MSTLLSILGLVIGVISVVATWHYSTQKKRLVRRAEEHKKQIDKIETYTKSTGYKTMLHDGLHSLSYAGAISLLGLCVQTFIPTIIHSEDALRFIQQMVSGVYGGAGLVLLSDFRLLAKVYTPGESITELNNKIENIKNEIEPQI